MTATIKVTECFKRLQQSLYHLAAALYHDADFPLWLSNTPNTKSARQQVYRILNQLEYTATQAPRNTIQLPGLVGASNETLQIIKQVNTTKDEFKLAIQQLKKDKKNFTDTVLQHSLEELLNKRHPQAQMTLHRSGLSRLHLKQCYRHIPLLEHKPEKVSWTWAHTRAIKRITVKQAEIALLKKRGLPGIQQQLQKLRGLIESEPLAIVQEIAPHVRANIVTSLEDGERKRHMIPATLPIFYPDSPHGQLPIVSDAGAKQNKSPYRLTRSDQKLASEIFLPALRVYRYNT
jgi:hypothetical protein